MPRPSHWDLVADDPQRAITFYSGVFGWSFNKWDGPMDYWMIATGEGPGIDGGLGQRRAPEDSSSNVIDVPDIDAYIGKIVQAGGTQIVPKSPVPGVGWLAYFLDTERNLFGIMQYDEQAG